MASIKRILRTYPWKNCTNFNGNGSFIWPTLHFAWFKLRSDLERLLIQCWTFDFSAGNQRSMLVKHGFNETKIAFISVEKLLIFQLKWVIYTSKNILCLIKACAQISNSLFHSVKLSNLYSALNLQC